MIEFPFALPGLRTDSGSGKIIPLTVSLVKKRAWGKPDIRPASGRDSLLII